MPDLLRWGTVDPAADAQFAYSLYHFAYNNPILYNDPTGLIGEAFMTTFVNEETGETYEVDDGYDFEFSVSDDEFEEVKEKGGAKGTSVYNRWFWWAVGHELQQASGETWFDQLMQFFVYDDAGDAVIIAAEGEYAAAALTLALSRVKLGKGSKLIKKLFKHGKNKRLPTPKLDTDQFDKVGDKFVHKKTGAIYSKSHTSHGNVRNEGTQWKVWPKGTTDFGKASKKAGTRVTVDGDGNVIGN